MKPYPFKFEPLFKEKIWGGRKLETIFGKTLPTAGAYGESWELVDLPDDRSRVADGPLAGTTISELLQRFGEKLTGPESKAPHFPLLIKILDAQDVLSVQVHPDSDACRRLGTGVPKTECWYILDAEPGAVIYKGLRPGITRERFAAAVTDGTVAELLNKMTVQPGECHFLPAGTVHTIGAGLLIAEVQTPSDTTFRVFDWNRVDKHGIPRRLHLSQAMESIHFDQNPWELTITDHGRLVDSPSFKVDKIDLDPNERIDFDQNEMQVWLLIDGEGKIRSEHHETILLKKGDTVLIPYHFKGTADFNHNTALLKITVSPILPGRH